MYKKGFTLLELLLVISIMGVLATLIIGNFLTSIKKGRDSKRKQDLQTVQKALELYFEDNKTYPVSSTYVPNIPLCHPNGCGTGNTAGATYIQKTPADPTSGYNYSYISTDGKSYKLYACLENDQDVGPGVKLLNGAQDTSNGYPGTTCGSCKCMFGVSSPNTTP